MRAVLIALGLFATSLAAGAQNIADLTGTVYVTADDLSSNGVLNGCALQYQAITQDFRYANGGLVMVGGSFNLNLYEQAGEKTVGVLLKVGLKELVLGKQTQITPPVFAYLASKNGTTAHSVVESAISDTPGYRTFAIKVDHQVGGVLGDILSGGPVRIGFNRKQDGMDVSAPLDLRVESATIANGKLTPTSVNEKASKAFAECFGKLAEKLK